MMEFNVKTSKMVTANAKMSDASEYLPSHVSGALNGSVPVELAVGSGTKVAVGVNEGSGVKVAVELSGQRSFRHQWSGQWSGQWREVGSGVKWEVEVFCLEGGH